ncbi:hypothetical protein B0A52_02398 [Exophiala mesophila]|uniref:Uncharacterized protein n=1 Tax=Exophiala mesophila TaxID=212818 RepID=A0A438NCK8_EXOME|nr:hypothetical protein B0A52_02398 [Exophiala mesophila]
MSKQKHAYALSLPSGQPIWPVIDPEEEAAILALLLPILRTVGDHRRRHVEIKEQKRKTRSTESQALAESPGHSSAVSANIQNYLTIGFNSTTQRLESLSVARRPPGLCRSPTNGDAARSAGQIAAVFVCRDCLPEIMTSSLPVLIATAAPRETRARLIEISPQAEAKMAHAVGLPRLGMLGLEAGAPGAEALLRRVMEKIQEIDLPWLDLVSPPSYVAVQLEEVQSAMDRKQPITRK